MSAWLCSQTHISAIVNAAEGSVAEFQMLLAENIRSLEARYPGRDFLDEWKAEAKTYMLDTSVGVSPTQVVKCCNSFDYQACETEDYNDTPAAAYVAEVRALAVKKGGRGKGPDYNNAEWSL